MDGIVLSPVGEEPATDSSPAHTIPEEEDSPPGYEGVVEAEMEAGDDTSVSSMESGPQGTTYRPGGTETDPVEGGIEGPRGTALLSLCDGRGPRGTAYRPGEGTETDPVEGGIEGPRGTAFCRRETEDGLRGTAYCPGERTDTDPVEGGIDGPWGTAYRPGEGTAYLGHPSEGPCGAGTDLGHPTEGLRGANTHRRVVASDLGLPTGLKFGGNNAGGTGAGVGNRGASWGGGTALGGSRLTALSQGQREVVGIPDSGGGSDGRGQGNGIPWLKDRGWVIPWTSAVGVTLVSVGGGLLMNECAHPSAWGVLVRRMRRALRGVFSPGFRG